MAFQHTSWEIFSVGLTMRKAGGAVLLLHLAAQGFNFAALRFSVHAFPPSIFTGFGGATFFLRNSCSTHEFLQARQGVFAVFLLAAKFLCLDDDNTLAGDTLIADCQQALLVEVR